MAEEKKNPKHFQTSSDHIEEAISPSYGKHVLDVDDAMVHNEERAPEARGLHYNQISSSYWFSFDFLGTYLAAGLTFMGSVGGYAMISPLLSYIDEDVGPSDNIAYVPIANVLLSAVTLQIVGCLSDMFGRRLFFITGAAIGVVAAVIGATAYSVNQIIASSALFGIYKGFGLSYFWVISELVPMKARFVASSGMYILSLPGNPLGAKVALSFQFNTSSQWRGCYYFLIGVNSLCMALWYFCYHPPTFKMLHRRQQAKEVMLQFDWIGMLLYTAGLLLLVLGLTWGGGLYPWGDSHTIGALVGGAASFGFFTLWEVYLPLPSVRPLIALHLFRNAEYQACAWTTGIGALTYYGFTLVWPQAVRTLYGDLSTDRQSTLSTTLILSFVLGMFSGSLLGKFVGPRRSVIATALFAVPLLAAAGVNPRNLNQTIALCATGCFMVGANEGVAIVASTFPIRSQEELGAAGGLCGTIRQFGAAIGTGVFSTILGNSLATNIPNYVKPAVIDAGLPETSVSALLAGINDVTGLNSTSVPGLSPAIIAAADDAFKNASASAYSAVIYTSAGFASILLILSWWIPNLDESKKDFVVGHIHRAEDEKRLEQE